MSKEKDFVQNKIFVDDLNKIRLANPDLLESSSTLQSESEQFIESVNNFKHIVHNIRNSVQEIGKIADEERLRAVSAQNEIRQYEANGDNDNSEENQRLKILVQEKQAELERLKVELQSYRTIQAQQQDYIQQLKAFR